MAACSRHCRRRMAPSSSTPTWRSIPGVPGPQSTQSVWVHLIALQLVLEGGWPASQLVRIRKAVGELFPDLPWLEPPAFLGAGHVSRTWTRRPTARC